MPAYTQEQQKNIIQLHDAGYGVTEIGRKLSLNRGCISSFLRRNGYSTDRNPIKKDSFSKIDTEEKAYWLGMLYADGCVNRIHGQVNLALNESDLPHLEKLKSFLQCNNKISYSKQTRSYRLSFCCAQITQDLIRLGCVPNKSLVLQFPSDDQVPPQFKSAFMRGYVDGDGSLVYTDKTYCFSFTSTEQFIKDAIQFFGWKECKLCEAGQNKTWRCSNKKLVPEYLNTLYENATVYLDRKYEKYLKMKSPILACIKEI